MFPIQFEKAIEFSKKLNNVTAISIQIKHIKVTSFMSSHLTRVT